MCAGNSKQEPDWPPRRCQHSRSQGSIPRRALPQRASPTSHSQARSKTRRSTTVKPKANPQQGHAQLQWVNIPRELSRQPAGQVSRTLVMPPAASASHFQRHRSAKDSPAHHEGTVSPLLLALLVQWGKCSMKKTPLKIWRKVTQL